jgi:hypothetical protein
MFKYNYKLFALLTMALSIMVFSCNKVHIDTQTYSATINTVNAVAAPAVDLKVNFTGLDIQYSPVQTLGFYTYDGLFVNGLLTYAVPADREIPLKVVLSNDSSKILFNKPAAFDAGSSHTLFVTGTLQQPEGILVDDALPLHRDSTVGIRFINLSPDAGTISINLSGEAPGSTASNLAYKSYTDFILFPAKAENEYYFFEIRDSVTGNVITELFFDVARMRNETVMMRGTLYGEGPFFEVARIRH